MVFYQLFLLIAASVCTLLFIFFLLRSKEYEYLVENLDDETYFLKDLYVVGFAMSETKLFALRGKVDQDLKKASKLVWDNMYYEYYADLAWAQFLTLTMIVLCLGLSFAALLGGEASFMALGIIVLFVMAVWNICMSNMKEAVEKRRDECMLEFPNMVSKLSLLISSGMTLRDAWFLVAYGKDGTLYDLMKKSCEGMNSGDSEVAAIYKFGVLSDSPEIKKFSSAMAQTVTKGNTDLAEFLMSQASELWAHKRQLALQKGEVAAGKLIIPLGLMFAGIILIIVAAAMQSMSF